MENSAQIALRDLLDLSTVQLRARQLSNEELDVLEFNIQRAMMDVRSLKNERSSINTLYPEILAKIFEDVVDMEMPQTVFPRILHGTTGAPGPTSRHQSSQPPAVYVVSAVCRGWRDVTIGFPQLWSSIRQVSFREDMWLDLNLERSKATPLRIFVRYEMLMRHMKPTTAELLGRLVPWHAERIQELHLSSITLASCPLMNTPLPNLECLTLKSIPNYPYWSDSPPTIFNAHTPRLKQLTLHACPFFPNHTFSGLTHLCLVPLQGTSGWSLGHFLDVLRASPELEEIYVAQSTFPAIDLLGSENSKVLLGRLRILSISRYEESLSELLDMLIIPHPIEFLACGTDAIPKFQDILCTLYPTQLSDAGSISELRVTAVTAPSHPSLIFPNSGYTIISNKDCLQVDGKFNQDDFLFAVPQYIDVRNVTQLWLAVPFLVEPSMEEWRGFFKAVPSVVTLVISHRSSSPILSALTLLTDEETSQGYDLLLPKLEVIRIFADRNLSIEILSKFAEQRARLGNKLKICEVMAEAERSASHHGWGQGWWTSESWGNTVVNERSDSHDGWGASGSWGTSIDERSDSHDGWDRWYTAVDFASSPSPAPGPKDSTEDDLEQLKEFIDEVDYSKVAIDPLWGVLKTPALDWVARLWPPEDTHTHTIY